VSETIMLLNSLEEKIRKIDRAIKEANVIAEVLINKGVLSETEWEKWLEAIASGGTRNILWYVKMKKQKVK